MKNLLRGGAFLLAIIAAFAFTQPMELNDPSLKLFRLVSEDPVTGERDWDEITGEQHNVDYQCNSSTSICTAQFEDDDPNTEDDMINEVSGTYQALP